MSSETTTLAVAPVAATWVLVVSGELDIVAAPTLRQSLEWAGNHPAAQVVVDLSAVTFIDCAGVRPLLEAKTHLGERVHVGNTSARVRWFLKVAGLRGVLERPGTPGPSHPHGGLAPRGAQEPEWDSVTALEMALADMQVAMRERAVIERAKGVLMAAHRCNQREAWTALRRAAQVHNLNVRDVAAALTATAAGRADCPPGAATAAALRSLAPTSVPAHRAPSAVFEPA